MGEIVLEGLGKDYGSVVALQSIDLSIADGEIISFLGPSGCGKTTTLRLIAGLEMPTRGRVTLNGEVVSSPGFVAPAEKRNLGMVFQNYAVWPHMTVFQNVAYPLKLRHTPKREMKERVEHALSLVGMEGMAARLPNQLSGGQQQRVALARALVMKPTAMLLDEPLSNLDAKLRERMRFEIMELHGKLGLTIIYVTHDQAEAMVLSDRIVLMENQRVAQIGDARQIYREPVNAFVADFVGAANLIPCRLAERAGRTGTAAVDLGDGAEARLACTVPGDAKEGVEGSFFVRPEDVALGAPGGAALQGEVEVATFLGDFTDVRVRLGQWQIRVKAGVDEQWSRGQPAGIDIRRGVFIGD